MRFDSASPRTWLLGGVAAWSVLALLMALVGMGRSIDKLPDDTGLLKTIPSLPKPAPERLQVMGQYAEIASRPLFADDRRPHPFSLQPEGSEQQAKTFDYILTSVMITPAFKMAIIQAPDNSTAPLRMKLGEANDALPGWQLQSVDPRSAVFIGPEGERRLELRVFNGVGGEAPTVAAMPAPTANAPMEATMPQAPAVADANQVPPQPGVPPPAQPPQAQKSSPPVNEQAQMDAIRKRIEARRAQLRQEALLEQQQQKKPVK
ncbi:type II secretion system protein XpsN [Lysobacter fragariae]